jgi:hypothetical protein
MNPQDGMALAGPFQKRRDESIVINLRAAGQAGEALNLRLARKTGASENDRATAAEPAKRMQHPARTARSQLKAATPIDECLPGRAVGHVRAP